MQRRDHPLYLPAIAFPSVAIDPVTDEYYPNMNCTWHWNTFSNCKAYVYFPFCQMEGLNNCGDKMFVWGASNETKKICGGDEDEGLTFADSVLISGNFSSNGSAQAEGCVGVLLPTNCSEFLLRYSDRLSD